MIIFLTMLFMVHGKEVATVDLKAKQIHTVRLSLGKTTLLRFDEKPQKVIIGNKNYFNVEATENDLALQPLGQATTNLFVYLKDQTFSFILLTCGGCAYDDFIVVKRKLDVTNEVFLQKPIKDNSRNLSINGKLGTIEIKFKSIRPLGGKYLIDFEIKNSSKMTMKSSEIFIDVSSKTKESVFSEYAFETFFVPPGLTKGKLLISSKVKSDISIYIRIGKIQNQLLLERRFL